MKQGFVKTAAISPKVKVADPAYNAERICMHLDRAFAEDCKIIVFPELAISGYTCGDLFYHQILLQGCLDGLRRIVKHTEGHDSLVFVGLPVERCGKLYNVAAVIQDGEILGMVPKRNMPTYGEFYDGRHFIDGNTDPVNYFFDGYDIPFGSRILFDCSANTEGTEGIKDLVIGCEICEDLWVPDTPSTEHALAGANVIVNLSASTMTAGKIEYRENLVAMTSTRLACAYVYCSSGEGESTQDVVYSGHNIIAESGTILYSKLCYQENDSLDCVDIDVQRLENDRRKMNTFRSEEYPGYLVIPFDFEYAKTPITRPMPANPFLPLDKSKWEDRYEEVLTIQTMGLVKRLEHTNCKHAVVGISGGLDSTLALLVTVRAFDKIGLDRKDILAVTMPCFGTTDRTYTNACNMVNALGATLKEVNIKASVSQHFADIGQDPSKHDVTYENAQARERTQILMDLANMVGGMVIGTGDMSELALGWATYNGDHMSMYGVNAGVPKTLVRHLVKYSADTCGDEHLKDTLYDVLDTPVSPELLPPEDGNIAQKTEDLVGPYELHDFFLYHMLLHGFGPKKVFRLAMIPFGEEYGEAVIYKWLRTFTWRFFAQQFKRSCLPDGPKVFPVALSPRGDLRMPSDASSAIWMTELDELKEELGL